MSGSNVDESIKPSRVERRKQQTKDNLIDVMYRLTSKNGVEAITIQNIVDEADIAKGSFYNFFATKEELLEAVIVKIIGQSADTIDSIIVEFDDPIEAIATAFVTFDRILTSDTILGWFIVKVSVLKPTLGLDMQRRFIRDVQRGLDMGTFRLPNVQMAADIVSLSLLSFYRARLQGKAQPSDISNFILFMMRILGADDEHSLPVITSVCEKFDFQ